MSGESLESLEFLNYRGQREWCIWQWLVHAMTSISKTSTTLKCFYMFVPHFEFNI